MRIAIVGAGIAGLTAAYDLLNAGHEVTVFEASQYAGGLAAGFQDDAWDWSLEHFYHHLFRSDKHIIQLVEELGISHRLIWPRPITSVIHKGQIEPFDSPKAWITFPGFNLVDVTRFGLVSAYLRFTKPWRKLEQETADSWLQRVYGKKIYETVWRSLLIGKFGPYYQDVNMAWMWARLHSRSMKLGYFVGGFQALVDDLADAVRVRGGEILLKRPVQEVRADADGRLHVVAIPKGMLECQVQTLCPFDPLPLVRCPVLNRIQQWAMLRMDPRNLSDLSRGQDILKLVQCLAPSMGQIDTRHILFYFRKALQC